MPFSLFATPTADDLKQFQSVERGLMFIVHVYFLEFARRKKFGFFFKKNFCLLLFSRFIYSILKILLREKIENVSHWPEATEMRYCVSPWWLPDCYHQRLAFFLFNSK